MPGLGEFTGQENMAVENASGKNPEGKKRPSTLALSRQGMPNLPGSSIDKAAKVLESRGVQMFLKCPEVGCEAPMERALPTCGPPVPTSMRYACR